MLGFALSEEDDNEIHKGRPGYQTHRPHLLASYVGAGDGNRPIMGKSKLQRDVREGIQ